MRRSDEGMSTVRECVRGKICPESGCAARLKSAAERYKTMSKNDKNYTYAAMHIIPSYKWLGITQETEERCMRYLSRQVFKVSKAYDLSVSERSDLESEMASEVRLAIWKNFDPKKARYVTFFSRVLHSRLNSWQKKTIRRWRIFVPMSDTVEEMMNSFVDVLAEKRVRNGFTAEEFEREQRIIRVRQTVARLSPLNQRICKLYMKTFSTRKVADLLKIDQNEFFHSVWPACKKEFKKIWKNFDAV